jgi:hypothetical protein
MVCCVPVRLKYVVHELLQERNARLRAFYSRASIDPTSKVSFAALAFSSMWNATTNMDAYYSESDELLEDSRLQ